MGAGLIERYDVYRVDGILLVVLQSEMLDIDTVVVAPLVPRAEAIQSRKITPPIVFEDVEYLLLVQALAAQPKRTLRQRIGHVGEMHDDVSNALDMIFKGF